MGDRLEALLLERGWTQAELGRRLRAHGTQWSRQAISQKFAYDKWNANIIWILAQALEVPTDRFFVPDVTPPSKVTRAPR